MTFPPTPHISVFTNKQKSGSLLQKAMHKPNVLIITPNLKYLTSISDRLVTQSRINLTVLPTCYKMHSKQAAMKVYPVKAQKKARPALRAVLLIMVPLQKVMNQLSCRCLGRGSEAIQETSPCCLMLAQLRQSKVHCCLIVVTTRKRLLL